MKLEEKFGARGHKNIRSRHRTTVMITRDKHLSTRGDCIVAVEATKGIMELGQNFKRACKNENAIITLRVEAGGKTFTVKGRGDKRLTFTDTNDIVARKSTYVCGRTLMVKADKASIDINKDLICLLQVPENEVKINITVEL